MKTIKFLLLHANGCFTGCETKEEVKQTLLKMDENLARAVRLFEVEEIEFKIDRSVLV